MPDLDLDKVKINMKAQLNNFIQQYSAMVQEDRRMIKTQSASFMSASGT